jgi:hypothetical protein
LTVGPLDWMSASQPITSAQGVNAMQYLLMIYRNEAELGGMTAADRKKMTAEYGVFTQSIIQSGHFKAGDGLQPTSTATTVRVREGKTLTTDGPFAETREQLGGYYLVEAKDLNAALEIAARIPGAKTGSIEVRPVMIYD